MSSRDEAIGVAIVELSLHRHENISVTETVLDAAHEAGHIHYTDEIQAAIDQMWKDHQCQRPDLVEILRDLVDPDDCWYDHHGFCQTHGWLTEGVCPHKRARALLDQHDDKGTE